MAGLYYDEFNSNIGNILLIASDKGLQYIHHNKDAKSTAASAEAIHSPKEMTKYRQAIESYLNVSTQNFSSIKLDIIQGTKLQRNVWQQLLRVPYGQTISYSELAKRVGHPHAVRAVASACGKNPLPLVIPCHRIIGKDGSLGGFAWGLEIKQSLLKLESSNGSQTLAA